MLPVYPGEWAGPHVSLLVQTDDQQNRAYANTESGCPKGYSRRLSRSRGEADNSRQVAEHIAPGCRLRRLPL